MAVDLGILWYMFNYKYLGYNIFQKKTIAVFNVIRNTLLSRRASRQPASSKFSHSQMLADIYDPAAEQRTSKA